MIENIFCRASTTAEFAYVTRFVTHAKTLDSSLTPGLINCENVRYQTSKDIFKHLLFNGYKLGYTVWTSNNRFNNYVIGGSNRSTKHNYVQGS